MVRSLTPWMGRVPSLLRDWEGPLSRVFGSLLDENFLPTSGFMPLANVAETPQALEMTFELPGLKAEEVKVEVREGELWITGEKKEEKEEKEKSYHRIERRFGEFRRVMPLPTNVDPEKVVAEFKEGFLKVTVPKVEEEKPRVIEVKH